MNIEHEINQALALRDHWMQVPHKCGLTDCPGDLNRRKLEMWDAMIERLEECRKFIRGKHSEIPFGPQMLIDRIDATLGYAKALK